MNSKCRLCLCSVGKETEYSAALTDDGFREMLETVFRFPLPTVKTISGKSYNLPVTVCPQCSSTVRNFYSFTKLAEASQEELHTVCVGKGDSLSQDVLLLHVKVEPEVAFDPKVMYDQESLSLLLKDAAVTHSEEESLLARGKAHVSKQPMEDDSREMPPYECVDRETVIKSIKGVEKRINMISTKMDKLLNNISSTSNRSKSRSNCFEFTALNSEHELKSLEDRLQEKEYKKNLLEWLDCNITAVDSNNRIHQAIDLIFSRSFFAKCNWTGKTYASCEQKTEIGNRTNVLELFRLIGSTDICILNQRAIKHYLIKKLRYSKDRINLMGTRKSSCRRRSSYDNMLVLSNKPLSKARMLP